MAALGHSKSGRGCIGISGATLSRPPGEENVEMPPHSVSDSPINPDTVVILKTVIMIDRPEPPHLN